MEEDFNGALESSTSDAILLNVLVLSFTLIFSFLMDKSFVWSSPEFSLSSLDVCRDTLLWPDEEVNDD